MDTDEIIWLVVAVVAVLAIALLVWLLMRRNRRHKHAQLRERATELRAEADQHARGLPEAEVRAREEQLRAEKLRIEAQRAEERAQEAQTGYLQQAAQREDRLREADRIDPDAGRHTGPGTADGPGITDGTSAGRHDPRRDAPPGPGTPA